MAFLDVERATLERLAPGLDAALRSHPLELLESPDSPIVSLFKQAGGPAALIPREHGGGGGSMLDLVRISRAIASRSPSLSIMSCMHSFSIVGLLDFARTTANPAATALLEAIAAGQLLCASAVYEGVSQPNPATMLRGRRERDGWLIRGSKKPCTSSRSMDIVFAWLLDADSQAEQPPSGLALVYGGTPGLSTRPYWHAPVLRAAESHELVFHDVWVPQEQVFFPEAAELRFEPGGTIAIEGNRAASNLEVTGPVAFTLISCAAYIGIASALVERVFLARRGNEELRMGLASELEGAMAAVEGLAYAFMAEQWDWELIARSLLVRQSVQGAIERSAERAAELVGSATFFQSPDAILLLGSARAFAYHPPTRGNAAAFLDRHFFGDQKA